MVGRFLEHFFGIDSVSVKLSEFLDDTGTVGGVGDSEPAGIGIEHLDCGFA